jgi:hypothetical protein
MEEAIRDAIVKGFRDLDDRTRRLRVSGMKLFGL